MKTAGIKFEGPLYPKEISAPPEPKVLTDPKVLAWLLLQGQLHESVDLTEGERDGMVAT